MEEKKTPECVSLKNRMPYYNKLIKHDSQVNLQLYKRCWKKHSLVFLDETNTQIISIVYIQHSTKFPEYGQHGFHLMKFTLLDDNAKCYIDEITDQIHLYYANPIDIIWYPGYIWWYKTDDNSNILHENILPYDSKNSIIYELIDKGDIYVLKFIRNFKNCPHATLRGRALGEYINRLETETGETTFWYHIYPESNNIS